jgi:hypothetical protein
LLDFLRNEAQRALSVAFQLKKTERNTVSSNFFEGLSCLMNSQTVEIDVLVNELSEIVGTIYEEE